MEVCNEFRKTRVEGAHLSLRGTPLLYNLGMGTSIRAGRIFIVTVHAQNYGGISNHCFFD